MHATGPDERRECSCADCEALACLQEPQGCLFPLVWSSRFFPLPSLASPSRCLKSGGSGSEAPQDSTTLLAILVDASLSLFSSALLFSGAYGGGGYDAAAPSYGGGAAAGGYAVDSPTATKSSQDEKSGSASQKLTPLVISQILGTQQQHKDDAFHVDGHELNQVRYLFLTFLEILKIDFDCLFIL